MYAFDAIEPRHSWRTSMVAIRWWVQRYGAPGEVPTAARLACGPDMPVAGRRVLGGALVPR